MSLYPVLGGADDFVVIADWAEDKKKWLSKFLDMRSGVPSHDRFNAILAGLKPAEIEKCLLSWITALHEVTDGQVIAIAGKTVRRSFDAASSKAAIHMVSALATANHVSLGQVSTDAKSNEIPAIPKLREIIEVSGCLVTIDAADFPYASHWTKLKAIGMTVNIVKQNGKETCEVRYYIVSKYLTGKRFAEAVRSQWGIEYSLHWQLDVTFGEDQSRIRKGHADINFSLRRRTSLSLWKNKRLKAGRNDKYLLEVILGK